MPKIIREREREKKWTVSKEEGEKINFVFVTIILNHSTVIHV